MGAKVFPLPSFSFNVVPLLIRNSIWNNKAVMEVWLGGNQLLKNFILQWWPEYQTLLKCHIKCVIASHCLVGPPLIAFQYSIWSIIMAFFFAFGRPTLIDSMKLCYFIAGLLRKLHYYNCLDEYQEQAVRGIYF